MNHLKALFNLEAIDQQLGDTFWSPIEVARFNDTVIRAAAFKGEYHWHSHEHEDECFLVMKGSIIIDMETGSVALHEGEGYVVPKGTQHRPRAQERAVVLLIEPAKLISTGNE